MLAEVVLASIYPLEGSGNAHCRSFSLLTYWPSHTRYTKYIPFCCMGDRGSTVVKVLCYKLEGHLFDPSWCQWIFSLAWNRSDRTMVLGSTQPLAEMSTRRISWGKGSWCIRLTTYHHPVPLSRNLGTLTSWNPLGLSGPVMELLYHFYLLLYNMGTVHVIIYCFTSV
jgi:hypothetical protein